MAIWDDVLPEIDREVYEAVGWGRGRGFGERPVLLVIDAMYSFTGDYPQPVLESIKKHRTACGEAAWESMGHIAVLLEAWRERELPVIYTVMDQRADSFDRYPEMNSKHPDLTKRTDMAGSYANEVPDLIAPDEADIIITKPKPSAFFGTPLVTYLNYLQADSVIITGCVTSGCVRAAAVDAGQYGYKVIVPEECVWDRGELTHKINLFDIHHKCGDVLATEAVIDYTRSLPKRLFGARTPIRRVPDPDELPVIDRQPDSEGALS